MIGHQNTIGRSKCLAVLLVSTAVGFSNSSHGREHASAWSLPFDGVAEYDCATFDAAGAYSGNQSLVMLGEPVVGRQYSSSATTAFGGIFCLYAESTAQCSAACGDLNGDGIVGLIDFGVLQVCFSDSPVGQCLCADLNSDDTIDLIDYSIFSACPSSP